MNACGSPSRRESQRYAATLRLALLLPILAGGQGAEAVEWTGRVSVLGSAAHPVAGDTGADTPGVDTPTADQQSLRLMAGNHGGDNEWSAHVATMRQKLRGFVAGGAHSSALFRYRVLADSRTSGDGVQRFTRIGWEVDRAVYKRRFGRTGVSVGRQPIDWGSGRFWQPLNVFGAFAPTDLDTDYKPGIDAAVLNWYPSDFSSLTGVYALAPHDDASVKDSAALHYRRQVGATSQVALIAGQVIGNRVFGASLEGDARGVGWRIEGLRSRLEQTGERVFAWIAGLDYQFENGALVSIEWYDNGRGARSQAALPRLSTDRLVTHGLQQHLSRNVLGFAAQKDVTPLLRANYTLLISALKNASGHRPASLLHQLNLVYSVSNESDLLLSLSNASGQGLNKAQQPQSEFGHLPASATLRWRLYF